MKNSKIINYVLILVVAVVSLFALLTPNFSKENLDEVNFRPPGIVLEPPHCNKGLPLMTSVLCRIT